MKKRFTILIAAIAAILMMAQPGKVLGQTKTAPTFSFTQNTQTYGWSGTPANSTDLSVNDVFTNGNITFTYTAKGSGSTNLRWWDTSDGLRSYKGNKFKIATSNGTIESITFTGSCILTESTSTGGTISNNHDWTKPENGSVTEVEFECTQSSGNKTIQTVTVTIATSGGSSPEVSSVTYTVTSTSSVSATSGTAPLGSTATFSQTYNTACQMTGDNSMTFTLHGCEGRTIKSVVLSMHSNKKSGSGTLSITAGETTLASISPAAPFNSSSWHSEWSLSYVDVTPTMSNTNYEVQSGEDVVITIVASTSSLYCQSFTINYANTTEDPMVFALPLAQVVTNEEQTISTSNDKAFEIAALNIVSQNYTIAYCDENGNVLDTDTNPYPWFTPTISNNKVAYSVEENTLEVDRVAYFKVCATVSATKYYSAICSLTQKHQPFTYTLVDGSSVKLEAGKHYIIASGGDGTVKVMGAHSTDPTKNGYRTYVDDVSVSSKQITEKDGMYEVVFSGDDTNKWTMYDVNYGLFICSTNSGGNITTSKSISDNTKWSVSISSGAATITAQAGTASTFRYNSGSPRFSGYASGQNAVYLFKRDGDTDLEFHSNTSLANPTLSDLNTMMVKPGAVLTFTGTPSCTDASWLVIKDGGQLVTNKEIQATVEKDVTAYSSATGLGNTDGWHFIALPINSNEITPIEAMLTGTYDLYRLDPASNKWQNYRTHDGNAAAGFKLENGRGYLYANETGFTIDFAGEVKAAAVTQDLTIYEGWNLIGNPFTYNVYVNRSYYKMNDNKKGVEIVESYWSDPIAPCTGIVVKATVESETVTFSKTAPEAPVTSANNGNLQMVLSQTVTNRGGKSVETLDNAIVSFNEGSQLEKFYFGNQNANIYIPQDKEEYAIVSASAFGELPVNFTANQSGEYTLTFNAEDVEMGYLHLIDNMTGVNIDLLANPSYTFNANVDDYESRFRLVFSAKDVETTDGNADFAFINDGNIIVAGTGTVRVYDITGRMVASSDNANSVSTVGMTPGVYVLQLVNGTETKTQTQKIIVK